MAINEKIYKGKKYRVLTENMNGLKKWNRYSFWTSASDVEFENGTTLESKLSLFSRLEQINGLSDDIDADNASALSASVALVKTVRDSLIKTFQDMFQLRLGDLKFSRDASGGIWVEWPAQEGTGADSVKKKLGESEYLIRRVIFTDRLTDAQGNPEWWLPKNEVNEDGEALYEVIHVRDDSITSSGNGERIESFFLGRYQTVYICVEEITANKYNLPPEADNNGLWRDSIKALYNPDTGNITVNYGKASYAGGGNACKMTILYKTPI